MQITLNREDFANDSVFDELLEKIGFGIDNEDLEDDEDPIDTIILEVDEDQIEAF